MREDGEARFREPKTVYEDRELVEKATPSSTKYNNKWTVTIFGQWQISRSVIAPVLDPGGLFKGHDLHKGAQLSSSIEEMDAVTLIYWLSKFVVEVAKKSGERYPPKTVYRIVCDALVFDILHEKKSWEFLRRDALNVCKAISNDWTPNC